MTKNEYLIEKLQANLANHITELTSAYGEVTIECEVHNLLPVMIELRDREEFSFDQLIDLCGVDYLHYGDYDWETESATEHGFSRGVERQEAKAYAVNKPRFAVVYHLLSTKKIIVYGSNYL